MSNAESSPIPISTSLRLGRLPMRLLLAVATASLSYFTYPRLGIWVLLYPTVGLIYLAGRGLRFWKAYLVGLLAGFTFFAAQTSWLSQYLGPVPLIALSLLEGIIFAVFYALSQAVSTAFADRFTGASRSVFLALTFSVFWVAREWFSGNYPYGGFPWAKLVSSQSDTLVARWVWLGGSPLADFMIAFCVIFAIEFLRQGVTIRRTATALFAFVALILVPVTFAISNQSEDGTMTVGAAQGSAKSGLFANRDAGKLLANHILATEALIATGKKFDVVVWPENAVDLDLFGNPDNYRRLETFVNKLGKPLIFGTVTNRDKLFNTSVLWLPKKGISDWYDKTRPVPFAEYVPDRAFWSKIAPDLIGLLSYDFAPGKRDGIFKLGDKRTGILICFEIAVDQVSRQLVSGGAEVIFSQTNNSDFGKSDEAYQQLAIARLRAIETGRALVNISTVGPSAVYLPDGSAQNYLSAYQRGFMLDTVPLRTSKTPAMFIAEPLELGFAAVALVLSLLLMASNTKRRLKK